IGGSICWNYVASCIPAVVLGLNGTLHLAMSDGTKRELAAAEFILGPFETARADDEILLSISWPKAPAKTGSAYKKWGLVTDALPVVGLCVSVSLDNGGRCETARVAVAGLSRGAQLAPAGAAALIGTHGNEASIASAMESVAASLEVRSDRWADADYRRQLIRSIGADVAATAFRRARG
ncbi:MAG: hypothetical protein E2O35_02635, partial [Proteobacteria bacterium]